MRTSYTIAVGYDGSPDADAAVRWAFRHACEPHHYVVAVHAVGLLEHLGTALRGDIAPTPLLEIAQASGFDVSRLGWFVDQGDPCSVLLRTALPPIRADLLVVGSRGQGNRMGLLLGSTSLEVVQHANLPVVVVPSGYPSTMDATSL
jgi:nucleotide-binding universal stress UspA family protein